MMKTEQPVTPKQVPKTRTTNQCHICNKIIYGSTYKLRSHLYQHSAVSARFKCPHCSKEYYRRDGFVNHMLMHTDTRKYHICDHCDRTFVDKRNLISHLKIHDEISNQGKYKCMACDTSYCEERLLKYHIRKQHFNLQASEPGYVKKMVNETWVERVMHSKICVEMTRVNNNVINIKKSDIKIKTDIKNGVRNKFNNYMSSVFASTDTSHYSKAICDYCNKEMLKKSLLNHIRERHLKLKKFKCEICSVGFNRHYQLVNHVCGKFRSKKRK